jgi:hypothetical protein
VAFDHDTDGVDQDDTAQPRAATDGEFGSDPAADGVPDDGDVAQIELVEQPGIDLGQAADAVQPAGSRGRVEAGVGGDSTRACPCSLSSCAKGAIDRGPAPPCSRGMGRPWPGSPRVTST